MVIAYFGRCLSLPLAASVKKVRNGRVKTQVPQYNIRA